MKYTDRTKNFLNENSLLIFKKINIYFKLFTLNYSNSLSWTDILFHNLFHLNIFNYITNMQSQKTWIIRVISIRICLDYMKKEEIYFMHWEDNTECVITEVLREFHVFWWRYPSINNSILNFETIYKINC